MKAWLVAVAISKLVHPFWLSRVAPPLWVLSAFCLIPTGILFGAYLSFSSLTHVAIMYMGYQVWYGASTTADLEI
jgi:hypothetical protein